MQADRKRVEDRGKRRWLSVLVLLLVWLLNLSLWGDLMKVRRGYSRVDEAQRRLTEAREENRVLKEKMAEIGTEYYQERIIRDKLNLQLPGEMVVVLPETNRIAGDIKQMQKEESYWEKWWNLIR